MGVITKSIWEYDESASGSLAVSTIPDADAYGLSITLDTLAQLGSTDPTDFHESTQVIVKEDNSLWGQVSGAWVKLGGGGGTPIPPAIDEVWIGPNTPTDANNELWVDTDDGNKLNAKVGGSWVPITAPAQTVSNEVAIQAADPIATWPEVELWYDTDATAVSTTPIAAYGKHSTVQGGAVGTTKDPVTWNTAGFVGKNMTANANGIVVSTAGRYQVNAAVSLSGCSGGAYMVPEVYVNRGGVNQPGSGVVHGPSGYWLTASVTAQLSCNAGDEIRFRLSTDIAGCAFDYRSFFEATYIGPL